MNVTLEIYDQISRSKIVWEKLEKEGVLTPFQSFSWVSNWYNTIGKEIRQLSPKIVVVKDELGPILLFPLGVEKKYNLRTLIWLGGDQADYTAPIINKRFNIKNYSIKNIWKKIINEISNIDHFLFKNQIINIDNFSNPLFEILDYHQSGSSTQALILPSWIQYYESMTGSKTRQTDRRKHKKLSQTGTVEFVIADDIPTKNKIIEVMIEQKVQRYSDTNVWNMFSKKEYINFYKNHITADVNNNFQTHFSGLKIDDNFIATHFGIIDNNTFYYLMPGQDTNVFAKYSPGRLLLLELLKWSFENNIKTFDFTGGNEFYKQQWNNQTFSIYEINGQLTLSGKIYYFLLKIIIKIKRIKILQGSVKSVFLFFKSLIYNFSEKSKTHN